MDFLLNDALKDKHISKSSLAKLLGVSKPTVLKLCNGTANSINFDVLEKLCIILDCTPNDLFKFENTSNGVDLRKTQIYLNSLISSDEFIELIKNTIEDLENKKDDTK